MIKWLAVLLMAANAGLWAWTQGWLGPTLPPPGERQREPQRLQQQVRPESIVVLSPRAASAALEQLAAADAAASAAAPGSVAESAMPPALGAPATGTAQADSAPSAPPRAPATRPAR